MRFRVEMWNNDEEEKIANYIKLLTNDTVSISQVEIIPFDKVILSTSSSSSDYCLIKDWTPYQFHQWIWFYVSCFSMKDCDDLADDMQTTPQQFSNLKLFFSQSENKTQRRETVIRVENIMFCYIAALENQLRVVPRQCEALEDQLRVSESRIDSITPPKPVAGPMPSGCDNYKTMGHTQSGFFMVKDGTKVKTVYCDFSKTNGTSGYETIIGINGIKTSPVYFYVQRTTSLSANGVIPFQQSRLNIGEAMNLATGVFTAPRRGTYFFTFTALHNDDSKNSKVFSIYLQLNGVSIGQARNYISSGALEDIPVSLQATLQLNANDKITLYKSSGILDDGGQTTHFTGMLLDEVLSL